MNLFKLGDSIAKVLGGGEYFCVQRLDSVADILKSDISRLQSLLKILPQNCVSFETIEILLVEGLPNQLNLLGVVTLDAPCSNVSTSEEPTRVGESHSW